MNLNFPLQLTQSVLLDDDAVKAFTPEWDELVDANPHATVFQSSSWYRAWIESVAAAEGAKPIVLLISSSGRLRAAMALQLSRLDGIPTIRPLSCPWADYHEAVAFPDDSVAIKALSQLLNDLVCSYNCPLVLDDVVEGGIMEATLLNLSTTRSPSSFVGAIDLTDTAHVEQVLSSKEHKRKWRQLQRLGKVYCQHHSQLDAVMTRLPTFIEMHRKQWIDRPDTVAPFDGGVVDNAFYAMVRYLTPHGFLLLTELLLDKQPIAICLGFLYRNCYSGYRMTFDQSYRRLSPGHLVLRKMMVDFSSSGIRQLDQMRGAYAYKRHYNNRMHNNIKFIFNGEKGLESTHG